MARLMASSSALAILLLGGGGSSGAATGSSDDYASAASDASDAPAAPTRWSVIDAGARGDGETDDTAAFQRSLDAAGKAGGGVAEAPAGRYRLDGVLSIPAGVTLQGTFRAAPTIHRAPSGGIGGSVLLARAGRGSEERDPFIRLAGNNAVLAGFVVSYPEWKRTDVPPVPYPPCVRSEGTENVAVLDCLFLNAYEAIVLVRAHRHLVRNVTGYPIRRGIFVDECYDIGHIENVHFWPFGVAYDPKDPYCLWINTEGVAFELARTDWHYVSNTFCFGYGVGYRFSESKAGSTNGNFLGLGADSCQRAVVVEQAQDPGLLITNGEFVGRWSSRDSVCLEVGSKVRGKVSLVNCSFWGPIDRCVWMRSAAGQVTLNACNFVHWDVGGRGSPAIRLDAGKAIVMGSTFGQEGLDVEVEEGIVSAILVGNQAPAGFRVENRAGRRAQLLANEEDPIEWTEEARRHYLVGIGTEGDARYLRGWHGPERIPAAGGGDGTRTTRGMRWSTGASWLILPAIPGETYTLTMELSVPPQAVRQGAGHPQAVQQDAVPPQAAEAVGPEGPEDPDAAGRGAGLYLGGRKVAALEAGAASLSVELPPAASDEVRLEVRSRGWVPRREIPGSEDDRTLGVSVRAVTMRALAAGERVFCGNTGRWVEGTRP